MPTPITRNTATIVDHIYYYEGRNCKKETIIKSGNFWNMTDHLPNFFLIVNEHKRIKYRDTKFIKLFSKNIQKFKSAVNDIYWEPLYNYDSANSAYPFFQDSVIRCFNDSFPLTRLSRKRAKDKQETQLSPSDRTMRLVSSNLANYHATVQKLLIRQVLTKPIYKLEV